METAVLLLIFTPIVLAFIIFINYVNYHYNYWKRKGIFCPELIIPFGHAREIAFKKVHPGIKFAELYNEHRDKKYVGLFMIHQKAILINDIELVNNVLVKDFSSFSSHGMGYNPDIEPLSNHLVNMDGPEWKRMRNKLAPAFTSNKMKYMYSNMIKCADNIHLALNKYIEMGDYVSFQDLMYQFSTDVIGYTIFGIETNSFVDPNSQFIKMGTKIFNPSFWESFAIQMSFLVPSAITTFKMRVFSKDIEDFFVKLTTDIVTHRKQNNITRNDFLQILIDMQKEDEKTGDALTIMEMMAQVFIFFGAGFETSSGTVCFAIYELAKNPEIQRKLRKHINEIIAKHNGIITYECINEMNYLTWVIEETLRMYPPLPHLFRRCDNDYRIPGTNDIIEKGTLVLLPIMGIQRDASIHNSPESFNPDRFNPEVRLKSQMSIPFGDGPRYCIGNRFGMLQVKIGLVTVLSKYEVLTCEKTIIPMEYCPTSIFLRSLPEQYYKVKQIIRDPANIIQ